MAESVNSARRGCVSFVIGAYRTDSKEDYTRLLSAAFAYRSRAGAQLALSDLSSLIPPRMRPSNAVAIQSFDRRIANAHRDLIIAAFVYGAIAVSVEQVSILSLRVRVDVVPF